MVPQTWERDGQPVSLNGTYVAALVDAHKDMARVCERQGFQRLARAAAMGVTGREGASVSSLLERPLRRHHQGSREDMKDLVYLLTVLTVSSVLAAFAADLAGLGQ